MMDRREILNELAQIVALTDTVQAPSTSRCPRERREEGLGVPLIEIQPERFRKIRYDAPRKHKVDIEIEATATIDIFIVPVLEFEKWKRGSENYRGDGFFRKKNLQLRVNIDDSSEGWYLILDNRTDSVVTVSYEVYEI